MCGGLQYRLIDPTIGEIKERKVYFPIPKAQVPVLEDGLPVRLCRWGKRQGEDPDLDVPVTGWARLLSLKEGKWNRYKPRRVKIPALRWMEKDRHKQSHWFDLDPAMALQGVLIEAGGQEIVYVVTRPATGLFAEVHDRMPLLVAGSPQFLPGITSIIPA